MSDQPVFWEGPGGSRSRDGITLKCTIRPDGMGVIADHSAHADLRVGDFQIVLQVSSCQADAPTDEQREALRLAMDAMCDRVRERYGCTVVQDETGTEQDRLFLHARAAYAAGNHELPLCDLARMTDQLLLAELWHETHDSAILNRLRTCIIAQGCVRVEDASLHMQLLECSHEYRLEDLLNIFSEQQCWEILKRGIHLSMFVIRGLDVSMIVRCTDQQRLCEAVRNSYSSSSARLVALSRITDLELLVRLGQELTPDHPSFVSVHERLFSLGLPVSRTGGNTCSTSRNQ